MRLPSLIACASLLTLSGLLATGCFDTESTCAELGKRPDCGIGGDSSVAGSSGTSGAAHAGDGSLGGDTAAGRGGTTGGSGGHAGTSSAGAADGGAGDSGAGGSAPCNGACSGGKPVCKEQTNTCVECVDNTECAVPKPACDAATDACVECTDSPDCKESGKPFCDKTAEQCVACLQQSDCKDATASKCDAGACKACTVDAECSNIAGKGVCDAGTCVQCTGKKFAACGQDTGTPLVCDSLKRTCTNSKQHSSGLCQACVTDAQCKAGEMCVLDKFGAPSKDVGYFCHWKKGDIANGAPALCSSAPPYVGTQTSATSVDGEVSDICSLRASTCVARNQFSSKNCTVASAPSDAACGISPPKDAKCGQFDVGVYRCTMTCASSDDCPSPFACDTGASPAVCLLQ